jgi:hypothetical protein
MEADLDERVRATFADIHRRVFLGDAAANPRLRVEVVAARSEGATTTMVLITPWTINGLLFTPHLPTVARIAGARRPVHGLCLPDLGPFGSVNLVADVGGLPGQDRARALAAGWTEPFRSGIAEALAALDPAGSRS